MIIQRVRCCYSISKQAMFYIILPPHLPLFSLLSPSCHLLQESLWLSWHMGLFALSPIFFFKWVCEVGALWWNKMFACGQTEVLRWVLQVSGSSIGRIQWQLPIPVALGISYISVVCATDDQLVKINRKIWTRECDVMHVCLCVSIYHIFVYKS